MKMIVKNALKTILCLAAVASLFALWGCEDRKFEWDFALAVDQHNLSFSDEGASTHILVYSTGDWTVGFDRNIYWGSLDRRSGSGNGEFIFSCSANCGISRKVTIEIVSGELRESIVISQSGVMSSATVELDSTSKTVDGGAGTVSVGFSTDQIFALSDFRTRITYYDEDGNAAEPVVLSVRAGDDEDGGEDNDEEEGEEEETTVIVVEPWISNVVVSSDTFSFDVDENRLGRSRKADLVVYIENADGREYGATLSVTQSPS